MGESTSGSQPISAAEFHRAPGVSDWRVTGNGPHTVFTATSLSHAAGLVAPVVAAAERFGILADIDVRPEAVVVRIPDRTFEGIPAAATEFAAAVSRGGRRAAADAGSLARAVDRHLRRPALRGRRTAVLHCRTGLRGVGRHGCRRSAALWATARFQPHHRRRSVERPDALRRLRARRPGTGAGGCRTRRRRQARRRCVRSRLVVARVARQSRRGHRVLDGHLGLTVARTVTPSCGGSRRLRWGRVSTNAGERSRDSNLMDRRSRTIRSHG